MLAEQLSITAEPSPPAEPDMSTKPFHYGSWRFLKTMLAIAWSAFAHPFSTSVIDLSTGEVRHGENADGA